MKGYRFAVQWIADNDDHDPQTVEELARTVIIGFLADLSGKTQEQVATDVLKARKKTAAAG